MTPHVGQGALRKSRPNKQPGLILDLFAGAGGWEEALRPLGLSALGIETEPTACATARAAGHERLQADVAALDPLEFLPVWGLVGSPPCQAYSTAGKGLGRADKPLVIACAHELAAGNDRRAVRLQECGDPRSLLTVEPLRFALALKPKWIALEQVPAVLELWSLFAGLLAAHGYETAVGVLSAERYGVPQTRKRAFLIASLDGPLSLPEPTHRSYNARRREIPEDELALQPWVSMAEALGWMSCEEVGFPRRNDTPSNRPSKTETGTYRRRDRRPACSPAPTLTARTRSWTRKSSEAANLDRPAQRPAPTTVTTRRSMDDALIGRELRPGEPRERGGWAWRNGNQPNAAVRSTEEPAPTVHFGHSANQVEWVPSAYETRQRGARPRPVDTPAPTMLASGLAKGTPIWAGKRPATTLACDPRVCVPGGKRDARRPEAPGRCQGAVRVTVCQAALLQGFPADYPWQGARTRQFEQVGNAVPPPLARRVLERAISPSKHVRRPRAGGER
jgi:DNA (cytosine-5)-methyltransferase 1